MNTLSRIDLSPINFELPLEGTVGIMLSGGLDSAVLLALMAEEITKVESKAAIQPFTVPKYDGSINYVDNIISYVSNRYNVTILPKIVVGNPNLPHKSQNESGVKEVLSCYTVPMLFMAINQNPPSEFKIQGEHPNRVQTNVHPRISMPFLRLLKTHIVDLIYQFSLEELLNITHSCTEQTLGRCNQCFQCSERAWAFEQLGKTDTGSN